jgi:AcrR family transcriptional regulator
VASILDATKSIFLSHGYAGTTVDEIARLAGVSRASFYTYFPSKRDVLLALGADSAHAGVHMIEYANEIGRPCTIPGLTEFVRKCFAELDEQASFAFAWTDAARHDEEIRVAGMKRHLKMCSDLGRSLAALRGRPYDDPAAAGLIVFSQLERAWAYCQLYEDPSLTESVVSQIATDLCAGLQATPARRANRQVS